MFTQIKLAWQHLKGVQATAQQLCDDHPSELADAYTDMNDISAETAFQVIHHAEDN